MVTKKILKNIGNNRIYFHLMLHMDSKFADVGYVIIYSVDPW